ncbi:glycoside hydrolase family 9 protein [Actinoplanes sp. NPDC023936]|uniref:glycoside hydrolase family 9 protein n=1 Tax=Actinoplanes sp. NPDC023936 TaxID=3154910 RepID=UPI003405B2E0
MKASLARSAIALTTTLLLGAGGLCAVATPAGAAVTSYIRLNQVGYPADQPKIAYLMGTTAQAGSTFSVIATDGSTAGSGTVGASRGGWNSGYTAVLPIDFSAVTTPGTYTIRIAGVTTSPAFAVRARADLYAPVAGTMTQFFQTQRDGADVIPGLLGRRPSHLDDTSATVYQVPAYAGTEDWDDTIAGGLTPISGVPPVDVAGGWFDAGDYLKFTHTTAYAAGALLLAQRSGSADTARAAEIEHAMEWLGKMWDKDTGVLYAQVGIGGGNSDGDFVGDHWVWRQPQADDAVTDPPGTGEYYLRHRPVLRANAPGAPLSPNLAGRVAAAFALSAQTHAATDPDRARADLDTAAAIYAKAQTTGVGELVTSFPKGYYPESTWQDDMAFGATELALAGRALGDGRAGGWLTQGASWARAYLDAGARDTLNLYDVSGLALTDLSTAITAAGATGLAVTADQLLADQRAQLDAAVSRAEADRFRAAADYTTFDATSHALGLIAQAARYDAITGTARYAQFAQAQANWVLGGNPWGVSLIIGAGTTFAKCPHHQVANLAGSATGSGAILAGAAVNGPNGEDVFDGLEPGDTTPCPAGGADPYAAFTGNGARFMDDADAWMSVEPAIDFTSTGLLAFALLGAGGSGPGPEPEPEPVIKRDTVGVHRPSNSTAYLRNKLDGGASDIPGFAVGGSGDVPLVGDWDGDGVDGIGYWRASTRQFWLRNSLSAGDPDRFYTAAWATTSDIPLVGDWDGDGDDSVATWRPGDQTVRIRYDNTSGAAEVGVKFGSATDTILVGDWNGDGHDSLGYYRPSTREFKLRNQLTGTAAPETVVVYGSAGDKPLVGDWNGDGKDTVGVFRPTGHQWHLRNTNTNGTADHSFSYGQDTDRPLVGDWLADTAGTPAQVAAANGFYADPDFHPTQWVNANPGDPRATAIRTAMAGKAGAAWFGNWSGDIRTAVDAYVSGAAAAGQVPILVAYNVPGRDCGGESSGGAGSPAAYRQWISDFAAGVAGRTAIVIVEPDAVALIDCLTEAERTTRFGLIAYAINAFQGRTWTYVDGGNASWVDADTMAARLIQAGIGGARGFAVNVSNFFTTAESSAYADAVNAGLVARGQPAKPYVVDTSRNANGGTAGDWCNPEGVKLGVTSRVSTAGPEFLLWIKVPGDSDGDCGRLEDLPAGTFSPDLATWLINGT